MRRFRLVWGLFAFAVTFVAFLILLLIQIQPGDKSNPDSSTSSLESVIASEVARRYSVPSGVPVVTKLVDVETLVLLHPEFYSDLQNGDWLVRYPDLLIVYRREEGKIVKVESVVGEE